MQNKPKFKLEEESLEQALESAHGDAAFAAFVHHVWFGNSSWGERPGPGGGWHWASRTRQVPGHSAGSVEAAQAALARGC